MLVTHFRAKSPYQRADVWYFAVFMATWTDFWRYLYSIAHNWIKNVNITKVLCYDGLPYRQFSATILKFCLYSFFWVQMAVHLMKGDSNVVLRKWNRHTLQYMLAHCLFTKFEAFSCNIHVSITSLSTFGPIGAGSRLSGWLAELLRLRVVSDCWTKMPQTW